MAAGDKTMLRQVAVSTTECPFGAPGDRLWVREPWSLAPDGSYVYAGDDSGTATAEEWRPAREMPRDAARLFIEVESIRLERLQDIHEDELDPEGGLWREFQDGTNDPRESYGRWWDTLHRRPGTRWIDNPLVWVITFHRVS